MTSTTSWTTPGTAQAASLDGRSFTFSMPSDAELISGDLVVLATVDERRLCGQLHDKRLGAPGEAVGTGAVLGTIEDDVLRGGVIEPFASATISGAPAPLWEAVQRGAGATMPVGSARAGHAYLRPAGVNRHTFLCGQSGSGKSYALGVLLEQIILDTELPLVILDPNADFVRLGEPTEQAPPEVVDRLADTRFDVLTARTDAAATDRLCIRFDELSTQAKAAVLRLDPLADREEYNALLDAAEQLHTRRGTDVVADLLASAEPGAILLAERMKNLGVLTWEVWAFEGTTLTDRLADQARVTVLDLGGFELAEERLVVALELLDNLWENRSSRQPTLIVIDEAHNVCPAEPVTQLERATSERLVQIANEGRKYGLWLLLCTQRPSRINPAVLSQCDNLALMRMNSRADLAQLQETFGFVPAEMLAAAPFFRQGECLMAGGFTPVPTFVQIGGRRTHQGGSDVPVPLRG
ncbi:ATP-binding protein [Angustibacter luteus]|uniref:ATP-binding protein n=1 Tax=Angustibacter luteus TaxID=658456 RepID=A0ABW1JFV6_9ACTN